MTWGHTNSGRAAVLRRLGDGKKVIGPACRDQGGGIPADLLERVFDPFFTTKRPGRGTGLGLSIGHRTVEEHGGRLSVESDVGEFTRFHLDMPADIGRKLGRSRWA